MPFTLRPFGLFFIVTMALSGCGETPWYEKDSDGDDILDVIDDYPNIIIRYLLSKNRMIIQALRHLRNSMMALLPLAQFHRVLIKATYLALMRQKER
ncbi:hypothetical protein [Pseudoalteromonas spongiae]|uniref:hypothetical protein n=1 Tax=Pseudoalteromonas spongiae TaxID=298657 RepID=UPI00110B5F87|nr:hypothetical protein [Pseudoalteromonas spongiae]TMO84832.1 hypothetical protein CWC15_09620 [Pseudoalteromonas spongiae]